MNHNDEELIKVLRGGGVVVMPTDTIYGIVGIAKNSATVNRIYEIRKRAPNKPCIILIGDIRELENFPIILSLEQKKSLEELWEGGRPVSVILECKGSPLDKSLEYLHRGTQTLAFRFPHLLELRELLKKTGPLIAPSANIEGMETAKTVEEARKYFGLDVDLYEDGGTLEGEASRVVKLNSDGSVIVLRP